MSGLNYGIPRAYLSGAIVLLKGKEMSNVYDRAFMVKIILSQLVFTCSEQ